MARDKIDFLNPNGNEKFSRLRGLDLRNLIFCIEEFYLEYRESLGLNTDITFGTELEYEKRNDDEIRLFIRRYFDDWCWKTDASLSGGGEITSPVLHDTKEDWEKLKKICTFLSKCEVDTKGNAGGHIHVGAHILGKSVENWVLFLKVYSVYENVLYRFFFGDKISARRRMFYYAEPIAEKQYNLLKKWEQYGATDIDTFFRKYIPLGERYQGINFGNVRYDDILNNRRKNTIEFRTPNASSNSVIWQNNLNAAIKMMIAGKKGLLDEDFLDYKLENEAYFQLRRYADVSDRTYFTELDFVSALEFVDLVFDKNIDKVYFLRQYIKDFQTGYELSEAHDARKFTK